MENSIQKVLADKNMTQAELASRVGIKREYLNKIINNHITPTVGLAMKIAKALDMRVEDLFQAMDIPRDPALVERQDKIIDFMIREGISYTDLYNAVFVNERSFIDRMLKRFHNP